MANKVTNEKPLKIPLPFEDTLKAFLETKPEKKKKLLRKKKRN